MLVTRREAEPLLGYAPGSLKVMMRTQRSRWPDPVACRATGIRALLWDLGALRRAAVRPGELRSRRVPGADADGLVTCLSCGRRLRSLGPHLARIHHISAAEYRTLHHLPASTVLMATSTRSTLAATRQAAIDDDPDLITRMRAAAPPAAVLAARGRTGRAATDALPAVREGRRRGRDTQRALSSDTRRQRREHRAHTAGYTSWDHALAATRHLSASAAADHLGVGTTTIKRWRRAAATH